MDDEGRKLLQEALLQFSSIATSKPSEWGDDMADQYEPWVRARSRFWIERIDRYLSKPPQAASQPPSLEQMQADYNEWANSPSEEEYLHLCLSDKGLAFYAWIEATKRAYRAPPQAAEPVAEVYTMEPLIPGGEVKHHVTLFRPLPAGTKLYTRAAETAAP